MLTIVKDKILILQIAHAVEKFFACKIDEIIDARVMMAE